MGELPHFIKDVPAQSLDVPREISEFSVGAGGVLLSESNQGDKSRSDVGVVQQFSRLALLNKVLVNLSTTISLTGTQAHFDAVITIAVRGFKIFSFTKHFDTDSGEGDLIEDWEESFDLNNPIFVQKGDRITVTTQMLNKSPDMNVETFLSSSISLKGEFRP